MTRQTLDRDRIRIRDGNQCHYCRGTGTDAVGPDGAAWNVDHMTPYSRGGSEDDSNLVIACRTCNLQKHRIEYADYVESVTGIRPDREPEYREHGPSRPRPNRSEHPHGFDVAAAAAELGARTRKDQGLPEFVEDPAVLSKVATLLSAVSARSPLVVAPVHDAHRPAASLAGQHGTTSGGRGATADRLGKAARQGSTF